MGDLSDREVEILTLVAAGLRSEAIAAELHLSLGTVYAYLYRLKAKLGAATLPQAVRIALVRGVICTCAAEDAEAQQVVVEEPDPPDVEVP